jgi:hypothetical protein
MGVLPAVYGFGRGKENDDQSAHCIDLWIENSIHAAEQLGNPGGSQNVSELVRRLE